MDLKSMIVGGLIVFILPIAEDLRDFIKFIINLIIEKMTNKHAIETAKDQKQIDEISDVESEPANAIGFQYSDNPEDYEGEDDE